MSNWTRGKILGRGSTATVNLATDSTSGEFFAVKSTSVSNCSLLQRERVIHSSINSPYVISYLGHEADHEFYNIFLEYASGGSVSDLIKKQKLEECEIKSIVKDVLLGLSYLHSNKIAHCDLKPQNLLIVEDGRVKIADLGCARYVDGNFGNKGKFMGTPMYMAPEVARGEEQGTAADAWAVGCTMIEMATGRSPWGEVSDAGSFLYRVGFTDSVPESPDWVSDQGKDFLDKCLNRDWESRWSVDELLTHPFLLGSGAESKWVSPKSTLESCFWDSLSESEEEEPEKIVDSRPDSVDIDGLFGSKAGPRWTWDDSWLTVRADDDVTAVESTSSSVDESLINNGVVIRNNVISEKDDVGHLRPDELCCFRSVVSDKCEMHEDSKYVCMFSGCFVIFVFLNLLVCLLTLVLIRLRRVFFFWNHCVFLYMQHVEALESQLHTGTYYLSTVTMDICLQLYSLVYLSLRFLDYISTDLQGWRIQSHC